jgi:hypothetical protein
MVADLTALTAPIAPIVEAVVAVLREFDGERGGRVF